jgi:hypothetical protein
MDVARWLHKNGAEIESVEVKEFAKGFRGVIGKKRVEPQNRLLFVPNACLITLTKAMNSELGHEFEALHFTPRNKHTLLAVFLLFERAKGENSFWHEYIQSLPKTYTNVPLFYTKTERKMLQGCFAKDMLEFQRKLLEADHKEVVTDGRFECSLEDFMWARTVVVTRVFSTPDFEGGESLVPMADMLNHASNATVSWAHNGTTGFEMIASRTCLRGAQLFDSYGAKCNSRYLMNYGFTLPNNEDNNQACLFFDVPHTLKAKQVAIIGRATSFDDGFSHYKTALQLKWVHLKSKFRFQIQCPNGNERKFDKTQMHRACTMACLGFLRVICASQEDLNKIEARSLDEPIPVLSFANEMCVWQTMNEASTKRLHEIPEPKPLSDLVEHSNAWNISNLRRSERDVLTKICELASAILAKSNFHDLAKDARAGKYIKAHCADFL